MLYFSASDFTVDATDAPCVDADSRTLCNVLANRRLKAIGLKPQYDIAAKNNPLPWTQHWISSKGLQVAPQETEVESYVVGGIKQDVKKDTFSGFQL